MTRRLLSQGDVTMHSGGHHPQGPQAQHPVLTLTRPGREIRIVVRPWLTGIFAGIIGLFTVFYASATAYLLYRDDILTATFGSGGDAEAHYQDRIAALRTEVNRLTSQILLDQDRVEAKVDELMTRHRALSDNGQRIASLLDSARGAGLKLQEPAVGEVSPIRPVAPVKATINFAFPPANPPVELPRKSEFGLRLSQIEAGAEAEALRQARAMRLITDIALTSAQKIERSIARLGVALPPAHVGGPFVPATGLGPAQAAEAALAQYRRAVERASALPLRAPVTGDLAVTSAFGSRNDPFLGSFAMHTGTDLRAVEGTPIHATAPGRVSVAGRDGGYGIMVELDHGNGVVTRYGHLSRLAVAEGERVSGGDIVGHAGSTGRSTGAHLHYETRLNGEPVDPVAWLEAGDALKWALW